MNTGVFIKTIVVLSDSQHARRVYSINSRITVREKRKQIYMHMRFKSVFICGLVK